MMTVFRKKNIHIFTIFSALVVLFNLNDCEAPNYPASLWQDDMEGRPDPIITHVEPEAGTLAGTGIVTITGDRFGTTNDSNFVFIGGARALVSSSSKTQLIVQAPDNPGDSLTILVTVTGAFDFAEYPNYRLLETIINYGGFEKTEAKEADDIYGIAVDVNENLYVSLSLLTTGEIIKVTPEGERSTYATTTVFKFESLRTGPDGSIYAVAGRTTLYRVPPGGGTVEKFPTVLPERVFDLDFDKSGYLYTGGNGAKLFRLTISEGVVSQVAEYPPDVKTVALRVFNDYVYSAGVYEGTDTAAVQVGIWRNKILAGSDTLGITELVFNWGEFTGDMGSKIRSLTFDADSGMYIAADKDVGIYVLSPPYTGMIPQQLYPSVDALEAPVSVMCWGNGHYLYINHPSDDPEKRAIQRVTILKDSAPYYGRQ